MVLSTVKIPVVYATDRARVVVLSTVNVPVVYATDRAKAVVLSTVKVPDFYATERAKVVVLLFHVAFVRILFFFFFLFSPISNFLFGEVLIHMLLGHLLVYLVCFTFCLFLGTAEHNVTFVPHFTIFHWSNNALIKI